MLRLSCGPRGLFGQRIARPCRPVRCCIANASRQWFRLFRLKQRSHIRTNQSLEANVISGNWCEHRRRRPSVDFFLASLRWASHVPAIFHFHAGRVVTGLCLAKDENHLRNKGPWIGVRYANRFDTRHNFSGTRCSREANSMACV